MTDNHVFQIRFAVKKDNVLIVKHIVDANGQNDHFQFGNRVMIDCTKEQYTAILLKEGRVAPFFFDCQNNAYMNGEVKNVLWDVGQERNYQLIPFTISNVGIFYVINVLKKIECIDFQKTAVTPNALGMMIPVGDPVLRREAVIGHDFFRAKGWTAPIYCSLRIKDLIEALDTKKDLVFDPIKLS